MSDPVKLTSLKYIHAFTYYTYCFVVSHPHCFYNTVPAVVHVLVSFPEIPAEVLIICLQCTVTFGTTMYCTYCNKLVFLITTNVFSQ